MLFLFFQYYPSFQEDSDEERDRRPSEDCDVSEAELATEDGEKSSNTTYFSSTCSFALHLYLWHLDNLIQLDL